MDKKQRQEEAAKSFDLTEVETKEEKDIRRTDLMLELIEKATIETTLPATHPRIRGMVVKGFLEAEGINSPTIARKYFDKCKHHANQSLNMALIMQKSLDNINKKQVKLDEIADTIDPESDPKIYFYGDKIKAIAESARLDKDVIDSCIKKEKNAIDWQKNDINRERVSTGIENTGNVINFNIEGSWKERIEKAADIVSGAMPVIEADFELIEAGEGEDEDGV